VAPVLAPLETVLVDAVGPREDVSIGIRHGDDEDLEAIDVRMHLVRGGRRVPLANLLGHEQRGLGDEPLAGMLRRDQHHRSLAWFRGRDIVGDLERRTKLLSVVGMPQKAVPELRRELEDLESKLIDLHPIIKDYVYHPGFFGSFSLKYVLTPLVPELTYDDLVIVDGMVASVEIARLLFVAQKIAPEERDRVRKDLLNYCERDTWAMVKLLEKLGELARSVG